MRLIDADYLMIDIGCVNAVKYGNETKEELHNSYSTLMMYEIADYINDAETVDAAPVRYGVWIWADDGYLRCSKCTQKAPVTTQYQDEPIQTATSYCPNCGADMRGDVNA